MKMKLFYWIPVLCTVIGVFASCTKENESGNDNPPKEIQVDTNVFYQVQSDNTFKIADLVSALTLPEGVDNSLILSQLKVREQTLKQKVGIENLELGLRKVVYHYNSIDIAGNPITLSAAAFWQGYFSEGKWNNIEPDKVCLMEHYTITSNAESPSVGIPFEVFVTGDALVIMPDYIGYGLTKDLLHPYMNHELCAINSVDAFPAGYAAFVELCGAGLKADSKMIVAGASQGAGNALAVHKYLDTNPSLAANWNFAYSNCSSGPYSPVKTMEKYYADGKTALPVVFPLTLKSMLASYPQLMEGFTEDMMYSQTYLQVKDQIDAMISAKQYTTAEINLFFIENVKKTFADGLAADEILLSDILSSEMLNPDSDIMKALNSCFVRNDLITGWTPVHPVKLHYSASDRIVSPANSLAVKDAFESKVTLTETATPMEHLVACAMWMFTIFLMGL